MRLEEIINKVEPAPEAKYVVFRCMDTDSDGASYYESIDLITRSIRRRSSPTK